MKNLSKKTRKHIMRILDSECLKIIDHYNGIHYFPLGDSRLFCKFSCINVNRMLRRVGDIRAYSPNVKIEFDRFGRWDSFPYETDFVNIRSPKML